MQRYDMALLQTISGVESFCISYMGPLQIDSIHLASLRLTYFEATLTSSHPHGATYGNNVVSSQGSAAWRCYSFFLAPRGRTL